MINKNTSETPKSKTRLYRIWSGMKQRCYNNKSTGFRWYGEKGIKVCDEWLNSFESFKEWALNNGYEETLTIDRIDPMKDYSPLNCQWLTPAENSAKASGSRSIESWQRQRIKYNEWLYKEQEQKEMLDRLDLFNKVIQTLPELDKTQLIYLKDYMEYLKYSYKRVR